MTREELKQRKQELESKRKQLEDERKQIEKAEKELRHQEYNNEITENVRQLQYLRKHKDVILNILPKHSLYGCNDENLSGAYIDHGVGRCARCMAIRVLNDEYDYKIDFEKIEVREIKE
jgi:hypothetical protein